CSYSRPHSFLLLSVSQPAPWQSHRPLATAPCTAHTILPRSPPSPAESCWPRSLQPENSRHLPPQYYFLTFIPRSLREHLFVYLLASIYPLYASLCNSSPKH